MSELDLGIQISVLMSQLYLRDLANLEDQPGLIDQHDHRVVGTDTGDWTDHMKDNLEPEVDQACSEQEALTIESDEERVLIWFLEWEEVIDMMKIPGLSDLELQENSE